MAGKYWIGIMLANIAFYDLLTILNNNTRVIKKNKSNYRIYSIYSKIKIIYDLKISLFYDQDI